MLYTIKKWFDNLLQVNRDIYSEQEAPLLNRSERRRKAQEEARKTRKRYRYENFGY